MKKILFLLTATAIAARAQTNDLAAIAAAVGVNVATNGPLVTYTVTVPAPVNAALSTARRDGESAEDYTRRAFVYGATGLIAERENLLRRRAALTNQIHQIDAKL